MNTSTSSLSSVNAYCLPSLNFRQIGDLFVLRIASLISCLLLLVIGKETAKAMAAEGAKVVVNDIARDPDGTSGADRVVNDIRKAGGTAVASYDSITTLAGAQNIIKTAVTK